MSWLVGARISLGAGWLDADGVLCWGSRSAPLREKERDLLRYLRAATPRVVGRDELLREVWGYHPNAESRAVDTTIKRLRVKLAEVGAPTSLLVTVRGEGYRLELSTAAPEARARCVGREREIARAEDALAAGRPVVLVGGPGMGRSAVLHDLGHRAAERGRRVVRVDAHGRLELGALGDALGQEVVSAEAIRASLADPALLLLLDDVEDSDLDPELLPAACVAVAPRPPDPRFVPVRIRPLAPADGRRMLEACWSELDVPPLPPGEAEALAASLDGIPLALSLAASLTEIGGGWPQVAGDTLQRSIARAWSTLDPEEQDLLSELAVAPIPLDRLLVHALSDRPAARTDAIAADLARRSLVVARGGKLGLVGPIRRFAAPMGPRAIALRDRLVRAIARAGFDAVQADSASAVRDLREAVGWALPLAVGEALYDLLRAFVFAHRTAGPQEGLLDRVTAATAHHASRPERAVVGWARASAALVERRYDEVQAIGRAAVEDLLAVDREAVAALTLIAMARAAEGRGAVDEALRLLEEGRARAEHAGSSLVATIGELLAEVARVRLGAPVDRGVFARLSDRFVQLGNAGNAGSPYWYLGGLLLELGPVDEGVVWLEEALDLTVRHTGDHLLVAHLRSHLALGRLAMGDLAGAAAALAAADPDHVWGRADDLLARGALLALSGDRAGARTLLLRSALLDERSRAGVRRAADLLAALDDPDGPPPPDASVRAIAAALPR